MWVSILHVVLCAAAIIRAASPQANVPKSILPIRFCCSDATCGGRCERGYCPYLSIEMSSASCRCPPGLKCCKKVTFPQLTPCEKYNSMYKCVPQNVFCASTILKRGCVCPRGLKCCKGPFCFECGGRCMKGACKRPFYPIGSSQCKCPHGMSCCRGKYATTIPPPSTTTTQPADGTACLKLGGKCTTVQFCLGNIIFGICGDPPSKRCCLPPQDTACIKLGGKCQTDSLPCPGRYEISKCGGRHSRQCCMPADDTGCLKWGGKCQSDTIPCPGVYRPSGCDGPPSRKCCVPGTYATTMPPPSTTPPFTTTQAPTTTPPPQTTTPPITTTRPKTKTTIPGTTADTACINLGGKCQTDTISCPGGYVSGKCKGAASRRCCKPAPTGDYNCISIGGSCQDDRTTCHDGEGYYVSDKCAGGASRRCCLDPCSAVRVISRNGWGARTPNSTSTLTTPVSKVFIHHTAGNRCYNSPDCISVVKAIQNYHMDTKDWNDIGYSFLVGDDGFIYEGRGWKTQGAHTSGYNDKSIGISFMGDFTSELPSARAIEAAKALIACSVLEGLVSTGYKLMGHRDASGASTVCPGNQLYTEIQNWAQFSSTP